MKQLLIDAIVGVGLPNYHIAAEATRLGLASFTGNQHNEEWSWEVSVLEKRSEEQLQVLYDGLCQAREDIRSKYAS